VITARFKRLADASLYLVCEALPDARLEAALRGGVGLVQLRCKGAGDDQIVAAGRRFATICERFGVPLILNDRPDLVEQVGADGVHVGQHDARVEQARRLLGPERIIGLSTHSPAQIDAALVAGVDYIGVGPVHATPTKPGRPAVGTELVTYAAAHATIPFFAIGGIDPANVGDVVAAGAERVAVVRAIVLADDPARAAGQLRAALAIRGMRPAAGSPPDSGQPAMSGREVGVDTAAGA
jgi:thiamine-phosphate pyrophosphorylase